MIDDTNRARLSDYLQKLADLKREEPEHLPGETWDAFFLALQERGDFPEEYADKIGKNTIRERKHHFDGDRLIMDDGEQETPGYYEISWEAWNKRVCDLNNEYHDDIIIAIRETWGLYQNESVDIETLIERLLEETPERLEEWARYSNANTFDEVLTIISHRGEPPRKTPTNGKTYTFDDKKEQPVYIVESYKGKGKGKKKTVYTLKSWEAWEAIRTSRGGIEKFLFHFMEKLQEETAGYTLPERVQFDARDLTDGGNYASVQKVKEAAETFFKTFGAFRYEWEEYTTTTTDGGKKKRTKTLKHDFLIHEYKDERGTPYFSFSFSSDIPPGLFTGQWTLAPHWIHKLKAPGADVLLYKFCRLQRTNRNGNGEPVTLNNDTIRFTMGLPTPERANRRYPQLIKNPIKKAIKEINDTAAANGDALRIELEEPDGNITEWLNGKTRAFLPSFVTSHNAVIEDDRQKYKEEAAKKKQERDAKKAEKAKKL